MRVRQKNALIAGWIEPESPANLQRVTQGSTIDFSGKYKGLSSDQRSSSSLSSFFFLSLHTTPHSPLPTLSRSLSFFLPPLAPLHTFPNLSSKSYIQNNGYRIMTEEKDSAYQAHKDQSHTQTPSSNASTSHINEKDPSIHPDRAPLSHSSSSSSSTVEALASPMTDLEVSGGGISNGSSEPGAKPVVMLAPPDGGYGWVVVGACFLNNFSMLGIMFSWGIFQQLYTNDVFPGQVSAVSWIGTLAFGCMYIIGGFFSMFAARIGYRKMIFAGSFFVAGGCIAASFATQVTFTTHPPPPLLFPPSGGSRVVGGCVYVSPLRPDGYLNSSPSEC